MNLIPDSSVTYQTFEEGGLKPMALSDHCGVATVMHLLNNIHKHKAFILNPE